MRSIEGPCRPLRGVGFVVALAIAAAGGCRQEPGRWDQAQSASEGKTAQQASADRLNSPERAPRDGGDNTVADAPPPFTPGAPSTSAGPITWTPKGNPAGNQPAVTELPAIDLAALASGAPLPGSEFNRFFPAQRGNDDRVAKQEKQGFAQYSLRRDGAEIAQFSITDLRSNPQAAEKFGQPDLTIDLAVKLVAEVLAFLTINGKPGDSLGEFVESITDYRDEARMRLATMICVDGVLPLGPDFLSKAINYVGGNPDQVKGNERFQRISGLIPGDGLKNQIGFLQKSLEAMTGFVPKFVTENNITQGRVLESVKRISDKYEGSLDYIASVLDMTTDYFEHTGTQTVARQLITRAVSEI